MKPLDKNEIYENLRGFLQAKGVALQEGSYSSGIQKACTLLTDAINLGQKGVGRAKVEVDAKLEQLRKVVHEKTAPRSSGSSTPPSATSGGESSGAKKAKKSSPRKGGGKSGPRSR